MIKNNLSGIKIRKINAENSSELKEALAMMNRTQGVGLFNSSYLTNKIESQNAIALGAFDSNELLAVGCAELINDFSYYIPFDENISLKMKNQKVGSLCTLCVREDLQGKGIGQLLSQWRMKWLKEEGCFVVLGVSWASGLMHTSDRVFKKLGFEPVKEVKEFFKASAEKYPFQCPGCRTQPCICSATLYLYNFNI